MKLKKNHKKLIQRQRQTKTQLHSKVFKLNQKLKTYDKAINGVFTNKQKTLLLNGRTQAKWTYEDIGKALSILHKSNTYEYLRSLKFPFPSSRTLRRWTQKIELPPGLMYPVINLLKNHFENAPEISRQCTFLFDEMAIESTVSYDAKQDMIYGEKSQYNVYFIRGLFSNWKQPIAHEFDDNFSHLKILHMMTIIQRITGLKIKALCSDLGGKNRGLMKKLGTQVKKTPNSQDPNDYIVSNSFSIHFIMKN